MTNKPLVSIVTPSYNQGNYLPDTIRSVLSQGYPRLEYGVVDGGSTDRSLQVLKRYQDQLSWWISEQDRGQADAVNKGAARSQGEVLAWLNSDDLYLPDAVEKAVHTLMVSGADLVFGKALTIDQHGYPMNTLEFGNWGLTELMRFRVICQPAVFIRRSAWQAVGGLDLSYHYMLDHQLWLKIASRFRVKYLDEFLAASRFHRKAKNVTAAAGFAKETRRVVAWMQGTDRLAPHFLADRRRILGGAYRLSARYLLDGGYPLQSLTDYFKALYYWPGFALEHSHRMAYAFLNVLLRRKRRPGSRRRMPAGLEKQLDLEDWPGINLDNAQ